MLSRKEDYAQEDILQRPPLFHQLYWQDAYNISCVNATHSQELTHDQCALMRYCHHRQIYPLVMLSRSPLAYRVPINITIPTQNSVLKKTKRNHKERVRIRVSFMHMHICAHICCPKFHKNVLLGWPPPWANWPIGFPVFSFRAFRPSAVVNSNIRPRHATGL
jgi:hypothetical protein